MLIHLLVYFTCFLHVFNDVRTTRWRIGLRTAFYFNKKRENERKKKFGTAVLFISLNEHVGNAVM